MFLTTLKGNYIIKNIIRKKELAQWIKINSEMQK